MVIKDKLSSFILAVILASLSGCSTRPPFVQATTNLVNESVTVQGKKVLSSEVVTALNSNKQQITLSNGQVLRVSSRYYSALGMPCRTLEITNSGFEQTKRVACSDNGNWFLVDSLDRFDLITETHTPVISTTDTGNDIPKNVLEKAFYK
ncbi:hypothetical protein [Photobacterium sp. TLY01]|uniref:hypothetical protein n=1 Tax=Photobacterium sp. TLY01 TaxID=2907534 RepID=UPI001F3A81AB|nr:hypothetical protein [Photobacterium sp. TLY01]UIP27222.1 hypothetical protein LN341_11325 [Photobacterium sp. TLY01]